MDVKRRSLRISIRVLTVSTVNEKRTKLSGAAYHSWRFACSQLPVIRVKVITLSSIVAYGKVVSCGAQVLFLPE